MAAMSRTIPDAAHVRVYVVPATTPDTDLAILSADERERAVRFHFERDRSAFVTARAAVRRQLGETLGVSPADVALVRDANGRPHLSADYGSDLDFNLSHSGARVAVGFAVGRRIGVDIEWHDRVAGLRDLVPQVMGPRERTVLDALPDPEFRRQFFAFWTRKEAIVKAVGVGLSYPLTEIDIPSVEESDLFVLATEPPTPWTLRTSEPDDGYTLSVAIAGAAADVLVAPCAR